MNKELEDILENIKSKELALRGECLERTNIGGEEITDLHGLTAMSKYGEVVAFLIYSRLIGLFDFSRVKDSNDIIIGIKLSNHANKSKIAKLWEKIKGFYPYTDKLVSLLESIDLEKYRSQEREVAEWVNRNFLSYIGDNSLLDWEWNKKIAFDIICECQQNIGADLDGNSILFSVDDIYSLDIFHYAPTKAKVVIAAQEIVDIYKINCYLLDCFSNFSLIEKKNEEIFPFQDAKFDAVVYKSNTANNYKSIGEILHFVNDGGICIAFDQAQDKIDKLFYHYRIPFVAEVEGSVVILCVKTPENLSKKNLYADLLNYEGEDFEWVDDLVKSINNGSCSDSRLLNLTKDDFRLSEEGFKFCHLRHPVGQESFVWKKLEEITDELPEGNWVYNTNIDTNKIITQKALSKDPFKIEAEEEYYNPHFKNGATGLHPLKEFGPAIVRVRDNINKFLNIPLKYSKIFIQTFHNSLLLNEETKKFSIQLCDRILTRPALLFDSSSRSILRVNASEENSVCYRRDSFDHITSSIHFNCLSEMRPIRILPEFDEGFIIYQLLKGEMRGNCILVAPTKAEQHTFFLRKLRENRDNKLIDDDFSKHVSSLSSRIKGIGFKNFRRFKDLPDIPLGGINILVGANNAGKSTFVKGLLLAIDNIRNLRIESSGNIFESLKQPLFRLDSNHYPDVHVGNFKRAISWNLPARINGGVIEFCIDIANFEICLAIEDDINNDTSTVPLSRILISDLKRKANFEVDYINQTVNVGIANSECKVNYKTKVSISINRIGSLLIPQLVRGIAIDAENKSEEGFSDAKMLHDWSGNMYEMADELEGIINNTTVEYIYAHGSSRRVLFDYNDRNDYMAMTLHDLVNERISNQERYFINKWLKAFGIGVGYKITSVVGESFILQITNKNGQETYLADMGMGTNQLITLLFRLAIFIHKQHIHKKLPYKPTIVLEEPEQNMHPAFQSKLADLFFEVEQEFGFSFLIETHSEYLVRRAQVIVAMQNYENEKDLDRKNPFRVFYFPENKNPYDMRFRTDGNFSREFGTGFYDEATNLLFQII